MPEDKWSMLRSEREDLVSYLKTLDAVDWDKPSLAAGWRVRDVVAHVVAGAKNTPPAFVAALVSSGFSFDKMSDKQLKREVTKSPEELIASLASLSGAKTQPGSAMLGEAIVHAEDVRRALGSAPRTRPIEHLTTIADYYKKAGPPIRARKRVAGLKFTASDAPWSTGEGPEVTGPILSLAMAFTGRRAVLDDLSGAGLAEFKERITAN